MDVCFDKPVASMNLRRFEDCAGPKTAVEVVVKQS